MLIGNEKLNPEIVKNELASIFKKRGVKEAILFGSVAKGNNYIDSDVDIVVDSELKGLKFLGLIEEIRESLNKNVDVIKRADIVKGSKIDNEVLNTGVLIYG